MRRTLVFCAILVAAANALAFEAEMPPRSSVVISYLHLHARSAKCRLVETYLRAAVDGAFAAEVRDGKLKAQVIDVEAPGNEHFIHDYRLDTKAVIIALVRDGAEVRYENLAGVWTLAGDRRAAIAYLTEKIGEYLHEL